jgi:hypothetical protein
VSVFPIVVLCRVKELDYGALGHQLEKSRKIPQLIRKFTAEPFAGRRPLSRAVAFVGPEHRKLTSPLPHHTQYHTNRNAVPPHQQNYIEYLQ